VQILGDVQGQRHQNRSEEEEEGEGEREQTQQGVVAAGYRETGGAGRTLGGWIGSAGARQGHAVGHRQDGEGGGVDGEDIGAIHLLGQLRGEPLRIQGLAELAVVLDAVGLEVLGQVVVGVAPLLRAEGPRSTCRQMSGPLRPRPPGGRGLRRGRGGKQRFHAGERVGAIARTMAAVHAVR
jgi:hypothetical protein